MTEQDEIAELIARVALKDRKAFKILYERSKAKLFGICLRILNDRGDAEAALQETYVKVWNKAVQFSIGKANGITWLAAIARNQAIDAYRSRKPNAQNIDNMLDLQDGLPSPETAAIANSEYKRVVGCLDELDDKHAIVVKQIYLNGWSYAETAERAKIPLNTAKTWVRRSLLLLKECLTHDK
ncbi:MAG: sigma-70 family RNA polymerase sigma factor [OCS116 cluster bacterium]|nr:sigma-70 family RNA polymerase sigma factor [OCS116 cluster bacterium]